MTGLRGVVRRRRTRVRGRRLATAWLSLAVVATLLSLVGAPTAPAGALDNATAIRVTGSNGWKSASVAPSAAQDNSAVHTCAVTTTNAIKCSGYNTDGQHGNGTTKTTNPYPNDATLAGQSPVAKSDTANGQTVASIAAATCAIVNDSASSVTGGVQCWGLNNNGILGDGTTTQRTAPVTVTRGDTAVPASFQVPSTVNNGSLWGGSPRTGVNADFSVRYTKNFTTAGAVTGFKIQGCTDDGGRAFITPAGGSRTQLYTQWVDEGRTCITSTPVNLTANTSYKLEFEMYDSGGNGDAELYPVTPAAQLWDAKSWKAEWYNTTGSTNALTGSPVVTDAEGTDIGLNGVTAITGGSFSDNSAHFCALKNGGVYCWGRGGSGEMGNNSTANQSRAVVAIAEGSNVTSISAGSGWTCAVISGGASGTAKCWGDNDYNQIGNGGSTGTDFTTPQTVKADASTTLTGVASIAAGGWTTCARMNDATARCWGHNGQGQIGDTTTTDRVYATPVKGVGGGSNLTGVTSITGGNRHFCATVTGGQLVCWGYNNTGQLGDGTTTQRTSAVKVMAPGQANGGNAFTNVASTPGAIGAGYQMSCATRTDGTQACWGLNNNGQLGDGTTSDRSVPVWTNGAGPNLWSAAAVAGGLVNDATGSHSCTVTTAKQVKCWGWGGLGQMGNNTTTGFNGAPVQATLSTNQGTSPVAATSVANGSPIAADNAGTCVVVNTASITGGVQCWGRNNNGELGDGTSVSKNLPTPVLAGSGPATNVGGTNYLSGVTAISMGQADGAGTANPAHVCALSGGGVYCWGYNKDGELGNGLTGTGVQSVPVTATGVANAIGLALGNANSCALISGGTEKCWGWNGFGQLGFGDTTGRPTPTQNTAGNVTSISMGSYHQCVTNTSDNVYCVGQGTSGELGNNATSNNSGFQQVKIAGGSTALAGATSVGAGASGSCAVAAGTVYCWGKDDSMGKLGRSTSGTNSSVALPVFGLGQLAGGSLMTGASTDKWGVVAPSSQGYCVRMASGSVNCWGRDVDGELGGGSLATNDTTITGAAAPAANAAGWNNSNITVSWTCATTSPATVTSCGPAPVVLSTEGSNLSASGTAIDSSGFDVSNTVNGLKLDKTAPTGSGAATAAPNGANGWYTGDATFAWTCADTLSGVKTCPANSTITGEGASLSTTATAVDNADNNGTLTSPSVKIDRTAPSTSVSSIPTWSTSNVTVTLTPSDNLSGIASTSYTVDGGPSQSGTSISLTTDGVHSLTYASTDGAGNVETTRTATVRIDQTAPTISAATSPTPNAGGWNNSDVTVTFTCSDGTSGVASCTAPASVSSDTTGQVVAGVATDVAGNSSGTSTTVKLDKTAPTISADRGPAANASGWNNSAVTVTYTCSDATSGIASCPAAQTLITNGADQSASGNAIDAAGNSSPASVTGIDIDTTAPTISASISGTPNAHGYRVAPVTVTFTCSDALSGLDAGACPDPIVLDASGDLPANGTVADRAGNEATSTQSVKVARPPTASDADISADRNHATTINLTASDPDPQVLTFSVVDQPSRGTVDCDAGGACTYLWSTGSPTTDSFTFVASDGTSDSNTGTIHLTLVSPPPPTISGDRSPAANANGWNNEPVTVTFTCGGDALASCTAPSTLSTDGADQSVSGTAADTFGQSASTTVSGISIDQAAPTLAGVAATAPNGAGWYRAPVEMAWTCDDALSGISAGQCPSPSTTSGEGATVSVTESVHDKAGNLTTASSQSVQIDMTAPSTGVSSPPTWSHEDVTLTLSATDGLSGVASTSYRIDGGADQVGTHPVVSGEGHHVVTFWSVDVAGNEEAHASVGVNIDTTAPSVVPHVSPAPNANGWNQGPVEVTFNCGDADSGIATCTGEASFSGEVDTTVTGNASDNAGNTASAQATVRIDETAPTVTAQVPAANSHGWFKDPVQVTFSCSDTGGSGVASCPAALVFAGDGADQAVTATGTDNAGNEGTASGSTVSVDGTAPTISGAGVSGSNGNGGFYGTVTVHFTCADELSGVVACPADQTVSGEGVHTVSGSVNDFAGNTSTADVSIRIDHDPATDPAIVHGTVTDASTTGRVAGALVRLYTGTGSLVASTTTGTDGTYTFPIVADGTYVVHMKKDGFFLPTYWSGANDLAFAQRFTVGHGTNRVLDQALTPGYTLTGVLTSSATGLPVSGATVRVQGGVEYYAVSDANGRYTVTGMIGGARTISVYAYGFTSTTQSATIPALSTLDKALVPAGVAKGIKGTTTSSSPGGPLAGTLVRVWVKGANKVGYSVVTGSDGRFSLATLPVGDYEIDAVRGDYQVRWFGDSLSRPGASTVHLTASCTTSPDLSWGDPCLTPTNIQLRKP